MESKENLQWFVDRLLEIPTVKLSTPYYKYDYLKVNIGLEELINFVLSTCVTKFDAKTKEDLVSKVVDLLHQKNKFETDNEMKEIHNFLTSNI